MAKENGLDEEALKLGPGKSRRTKGEREGKIGRDLEEFWSLTADPQKGILYSWSWDGK